MEVLWHDGQRYYSLRDIYAAKIYAPDFFPKTQLPNECEDKMIRRSVKQVPQDMYILVFRRNVSVAIPFIHEDYANVVFFWEHRV